MEPQVQPLYSTFFPTASGKCRVDQKFEEKDKWRVKMEKQGKTGEDESPPSINLGLGVGGPITSTSTSHCSSSYVRQKYNSRFVKVEDDHDYYEGDQVVEEEEEERERCRKLSVVRFTEEQLDEFKFQFKYMVSGYPVPIQLLLPIWRGFSPSPAFPPLPCSYLYRRTPPFVGSFRCSLDNRSTMDAEPGRCRRTDGKKWRCHQSVVPAEKYCTRHMHRGSKRSRKLVEPSSTAGAAPNSRTLNHQINSSAQSFKFPAILKQNSQPLMNAFKFKNPISSCSNVGDNDEYEGLNYTTTRVVIRAPSLTLTNSYAKSNEKDVDNHNDAVSDEIAVINLPSKLDFSSKSLLQGGERVGNHELDPNLEPGRCKRTDGKKWRCSKEVLPHQKYCAHHMYRGSKKPSSVVGCFSSSGAQFSGPDQPKMGFDPSTNLNISLPTFQPNPRPDSSGSTTETTVTDDSDSTDDSDIVAPRGVVLDV